MCDIFVGVLGIFPSTLIENLHYAIADVHCCNRANYAILIKVGGLKEVYSFLCFRWLLVRAIIIEQVFFFLQRDMIQKDMMRRSEKQILFLFIVQRRDFLKKSC